MLLPGGMESEFLQLAATKVISSVILHLDFKALAPDPGFLGKRKQGEQTCE
jgi:hypothetical protein